MVLKVNEKSVAAEPMNAASRGNDCSGWVAWATARCGWSV